MNLPEEELQKENVSEVRVITYDIKPILIAFAVIAAVTAAVVAICKIACKCSRGEDFTCE